MRRRDILRGKKGSNVGLVISFVIFATFVLFVVIIIQPVLDSNKDKKPLSSEIQEKIIEKSSYELTSIPISVRTAFAENCISLPSFISGFNISSRIVIKNNAGEDTPGSLSNTDFNTLQINRGSISDDFFKIYSGSGFDTLTPESLTCDIMTENLDYVIGNVRKESFVFESGIISVINSYSNYSFLKEDLGIYGRADMEISFEFANGTIISTGNETPTTNVFADQKQIEYISNNGDILPGKIITKIW